MTAQRPIDDYMSELAATIGSDQPMADAAERMRAHGFRHVPVLYGGKLVGILSDRDLAMVESLGGVDPNEVPVREAMTPEPYTIPRGTPVGEVVAQMAKHKYGTAVITDAGKPVGIFTTVDAMRLCAQLLGTS